MTGAGSETFHQGGRHVQKAHGRRGAKLAADGSHLDGAMIALMPTAADAKRLALPGGEAAADLHLTLAFLGGDASVFGHDDRNAIIDAMRPIANMTDPIQLTIFGVAHWNGNTASASWVWNVGDLKDPAAVDTGPCVGEIQDLVQDTIEVMEVGSPDQHSPWAAHVCAAFTKDLTLTRELEKRLGAVTFDRIRVTFGQDATDLPLTKAITAGADQITAAAAPLRRQPTEIELASKWDWTAHQRDWESAVSAAVTEYAAIQAVWRQSIHDQIVAAGNQPAKLAAIEVSTLDCARMLNRRMTDLALLAGKAQQREAELQGVDVPAWDLDTALVAAMSGKGVIGSVSNVSANVLGSNVVQSAKRFAQRLFGVKSGEKLAKDVDEHLTTLTPSYPKDVIGGAMTSAQHAGRVAVLSVITEPGSYYATEALDKNTCKPCREIDGTEYTSLRDAREAYPGGGYTLCQGGARCRGELIAVWGGQTASAEGKSTTMAETLGGKPNPGTKPDKRMHENASDITNPDDDTEDMGGKPNPGTKKDKRITENATVEVPKTLEEAVEEALAAKRGDSYAAKAASPAATGGSEFSATAPWRGPICVEGQVTGDGREFAVDALTWQDPPIPLRWNIEDSHGGEPHTVAVNVGRIDRIWRDSGMIMAEGVLDLSDDQGQRAYSKIKGQFLKGVSIDADSITGADMEYIWPEDVNAGSGEGEGDDLLKMLFAQPEKVVYHAGRIRAATLCDIPAFAEAYIELLDENGAIVAGGQRHPELVQYRRPTVRALDGLLASGGPRDENWTPPLEWFLDPKLSAPTTIQVTDDGRVYGHAAQWGSCHIGQPDVCVQPPYEDSHPYYMTGAVKTREGKDVSVGQITVGTGHAPLHMGAVPATEHYDNTGHAVADVAVGNDAHGIWVAGSIRPDAPATMVHALRAAGAVSGDWRRIGSSLRLVGLLAVNVPGFSIPKMRARVASAATSQGTPVQEALVAAGKLTTVHTLSEKEIVQQAFKVVMDQLFSRVHEGR